MRATACQCATATLAFGLYTQKTGTLVYVPLPPAVSVLLGHSSVRITERHYKPWVKTPQKKLEEEVRKAWG